MSRPVADGRPRVHDQGVTKYLISFPSAAMDLSPKEFEQAVYDLTNFLAYVGEPSKLHAQALGPKVLIFILLFGIIAYFLKREYWRDIH